MVRTHGWGQMGRKLLAKTPHGHWMTSTLVAGLQHDGILAPQLIPCPMTGKIFQQWLKECPIPEMAPGSIVVADNLPAHKVAGIRQCLEDAGMGLLNLPPYSPDFNALLSEVEGPIELVFAKALLSKVEGLKALLRRAAARSFDAICDALTIILEKFRPTECANYLKHAGYVQT